MADIRVHYENELHCRLECDRDVLYNLADELSFYVEGYKFSPKYKAGVWDGKIKMVDLRSGRVYKNLLSKVADWCAEYNYSIEVVDKPKFRPQVAWDPAWLDRWAEYGTMEPMEHQRQYISDVLQRNQCLVLAPTSSGKSYIMYMVVRYLLENTEGRILITVPSTSLVEQLWSDFESYAVNWEVGEHCQKLYGGEDKKIGRRVVIATWQSVFKNPAAWFQSYTAYLCDEAHGADAASLSGIINKIPHAPIRVGLTGTLDGTLTHELELRGRFGSVSKRITTRELMDKGLVAQLDIQCHRMKYTPDECKAMAAAKDYDKEIDYIIKHEGRNEYIVDLAMKAEGNALVLVNYIERHGDVLHKMLLAQAEEAGKVIYYIHGDVKAKQREEIRQLMETRSDVVLLATYGTLSTGVSIKNLAVIIFAHPYKAKIKNLQSIGRGLRLRKGKTGAILHDIADDFVFKARVREKVNHLMKHFIARLEVYISEQFDYRIIDVNMVEYGILKG